MLKHKKCVIVLFVALLLVVPLVSFSYAATFSVTVPAGEEVIQKVDLEEGDHILVKFRVLGTKSSYISFLIVYPNGTEKSFGELGAFDYSFVSDVEGEYELIFVNKDATESKLVTLNYKIDHYVFGIPELLFQALVIVVICVTMIAVYILLSPSM